MKLSDKKATLSFSDGSAPIELPVYSGSIGPDVMDIRKLYGQSGMFTFDPGFMSTASCESGLPILMVTKANYYTVVTLLSSWQLIVIS